MTIVASNSLTISNVNDGTITHTAYANSADGNNRFTTVYPNLNLGDNTKTFVGTEVGESNLRGSIRIDSATQKTQDGDFYYLTSKAPKDNYDWFRFYLRPNSTMPNMTKVAVKPNIKYTFSVFLKGTGQHTIYAYQNWTAPNTPWSLQINLTSDWKLYTFTVTSKDVIPSEDVQFFIRSNNGTEINLKYPKVEPGSTATPYIPSASEVTTADWPSYIGQYTDFTQADSTNPSDYTWSLIRGNDGVDGTSPIAINMTNEACVFAGSTSSAIAGSATTDITAMQGLTSIPVNIGTILGVPAGMSASIANNNTNKATITFTVTTSLTSRSGNIFIPVTAGGVTQNQVFTYALALSGSSGSDGYTVILTNESNTFAGNNTTALAGSTNTTVVSYRGATAIPATVGTITGLPTGMSYSVANNSTNSPVITFTVTTSLTSKSGNINVPLTIDGRSFTKVFTYSISFSGKDGVDGNDGTSVNITSTAIEYQNSSSGTTPPTGTWSTTVPSTPQGQFRWCRTTVKYSDGKIVVSYLIGYVGIDGKIGPQGNPTGITQQATEPTNKYAGMMWQYTGTSNITIGSTTIAPQVQYIYDGAQWRIYAINVANLNVQTLSALTANLGTVTAGMIKSYIDYTYYNNSATGIHAKAYLRIDANNVNQKIALQSPSGVDWGYIRQDVNGITIFTDTQNSGSIGNASGRYIRTTYSGSGINFINSNNASVNANGDLDVATPYTGTGSLYFDGKNLISSAPIIALNTITKSYSFNVGGIGITLARTMSFVAVTFSGQASSNVTGSPTFNNQLPIGFRPISPDSIDYMIPGHTANNGYFYFNPDGSIRLMADISSGWYVRGKRMYMTTDPYPS